MDSHGMFRAAPGLFAALLTALLFAGCATISTGFHVNETADFDSYRSFSWLSDSPFVRGEVDSDIAVSPLTLRKIENAIESELIGKGYYASSDRSEADFLVSYTIGTREKLVLESYPNYYYGDWAWHINGRRYHDRTVVRHQYTKGSLGVDIFDGESGEPIWHGWAEKTVTSDDRQDPTAIINDGVRKLLTEFPHFSE